MGFDPIYRQKAAELGHVLADNHCELLYGGGNVGLMNIIAEVMKERGCRIVGTITQHLLDMRVGRPDIDELIVVETMAFIAMPGGVGTMDEFFEVMVLSQLRVFDKPVALFNVNGFYDDIVRFLDRATNDGFIHREHTDNLIVSDNPKALLEGIENFKPVELKKWVSEIKEQVNS